MFDLDELDSWDRFLAELEANKTEGSEQSVRLLDDMSRALHERSKWLVKHAQGINTGHFIVRDIA